MKHKLLLLAIIAILGSCNYMNTETVTGAKIIGKELHNAGENSYYLVFTDKGTFTIIDQILRGNTTSSDWYGSLHIDSCYSFKTGGYRNGLFSMYKNIHTLPVKCNCK